MKGFLVVVAVLGSLVFCFPGVAPAGEGSPPPTVPGGGKERVIVARVNGVEITMASLVTMMNGLVTKQGHGPELPESMEEIRKDALDQLIFQELAYQKAKSDGMAAGQKEIDDALADVRQKMGGEEKFREFLEKGQLTEEDLRKRMERSLTLKRVFTREVSNKASVSEEEIREEYEKEKERYVRPEKVAITDVVFFLETGEAGSRKKAEEILKRIQDDKEKNPWNLVSDGSFVARDMEVSGNKEIELYAEAKKLKVGEISGVFAAAGNLHVIQLKEYSPRKQFTFEDVKSRIEGNAKARAVRKRLAEWEAALKKDAKVEIVESAVHPSRKDDV